MRAGFVDGLPMEMLAGKITPGMIHGHPAVIEARTRHDELRGRSGEFMAAKKTGDTSRTWNGRWGVSLKQPSPEFRPAGRVFL